MNATLFQPAFEVGASAAIAKLSMPISGLRTTVQNGYLYLAPVPVMGTPEEMEAHFDQMQQITMQLGATTLQDWRETFEPQVEAGADRILTFDYAGSTTAEVAAFAGTFKDELANVWDIHMWVNIPPMGAVFGLEKFLGGVVGPEAVPQARQLLQVFPNKSTELDQAFWELSLWIRSTECLSEVVFNALVRDGALDLTAHDATAQFSERFSAFLQEFESASWQEDPSTPLSQLKDYVWLDDAADPFATHEQQADDRERLRPLVTWLDHLRSDHTAASVGTSPPLACSNVRGNDT